MKTIILLIPIILCGCIADQRSNNTGGDTTQSGPTINVPPPQMVDTTGLEKRIGDQITASSNTTQNQMSGLVTASVSKLGEKVTGLETNLSELIKLTANFNTTVQSEIKTKVEAISIINTELKAEMHNIFTISNKVEARLNVLNEIKLELGNLNTQAQGQVGWNNKLENRIEDVKQTFTSAAGRDVNMLPKQAVDIIIGSWEFFTIMLSIILSAATTVIAFSYRYARMRAEKRFELEKQERHNLHKLLMVALAHCPADKAEEIKKNIT
jgi:inner membrane protein involved in colicin E2 resistance